MSSKIAEMSSNYDQGTTTTHTTFQVSQSLFDVLVMYRDIDQKQNSLYKVS